MIKLTNETVQVTLVNGNKKDIVVEIGYHPPQYLAEVVYVAIYTKASIKALTVSSTIPNQAVKAYSDILAIASKYQLAKDAAQELLDQMVYIADFLNS